MEFDGVVQSPGRGSLGLSAWVDECARLCEPDWIHWCDGSDEEYAGLIRQLVLDGELQPLNQRTHPGCYARRGTRFHDDAASGSEVVTLSQGRQPVNVSRDPHDFENAVRQITKLLQGSMHGRTMYVVPYLLGPLGSPLSRVGITITDNAYLTASMRLLAVMGHSAIGSLGAGDGFIAALHVRGSDPSNELGAWHFADDNLFVSCNTVYAEDAARAFDMSALRIASVIARDEGWLAERATLVELASPVADKTYFAISFPEDNSLAQLATLPVPPALAADGWKLRTVGDRIAWMHIAENGRLWAISPRHGFSDALASIGTQTNANLSEMLRKDTFYINVALTADSEPWWEGCGIEPGDCLIDWKGVRRRSDDVSGGRFAHPASHFIASADGGSALSANREDPYGVPIGGIVFASHRATTVPFAAQSLSWRHGVFYGATMSQDGRIGMDIDANGVAGSATLRNPMGMVGQCGYPLTDYLRHWLQIGERLDPKAPPVFLTNWFRSDETNGRPLLENPTENVRSLIWMRSRIMGLANAHLTAIGEAMTRESLPSEGITLDLETVDRLLSVHVTEWREEAADIEAFFEKLGKDIPEGLEDELRALDIRLISRWLNGEIGGDISITGACGRSLVDRRSTDGRLVLHVVSGGADGNHPSPCTRCRRDCVGDLFGLVSANN